MGKVLEKKSHEGLLNQKYRLQNELSYISNQIVNLNNEIKGKSPGPFRNQLEREKLELLNKQQALNKEIRNIRGDLNLLAGEEHNTFKRIVKQEVGEEKYLRWCMQAEIEIRGRTPQMQKEKGSGDRLGKKDDRITDLLKTLNEFYDIVKKSRVELNLYIEKNIDPKNQQDFLQKLMGLNRSLPSLADIQKIKRVKNF